MASVVAEFFQITGVDIVPPTTMAELIPYLLTVFVAMVLVTAVFRHRGGRGRRAGQLAEVLIWRSSYLSASALCWRSVPPSAAPSSTR